MSEYFAEIKWCDEDIIGALEDADIFPSEKNIQLLKQKLGSYFRECQIVIGNECIAATIRNCKEFETEGMAKANKYAELQRIAVDILEEFEDILEEHDITIPDEFREGEEGEARLFGAGYGYLHDKIIQILEESENE
jgi:hypothetical protein